MKTKTIDAKKLSQTQLKELLKLRLKNLGDNEFKSIQIEHDSITHDGFCGIVKHKRWADRREGMILSKLFIDELEYLLNEGVLELSHIIKPSKIVIEINEEFANTKG